nr:PREDICTED: neuropeptide Y receptor type 1-like [Bemisia tabaci]
MAEEEEDSTPIPPKYLEYITHVLMGKRNASIDLSKPYVKASIFGVYPSILFFYGLLIICGTLSNIAIIVTIFRRHLYTNPTHCYVINLALANIVKCVFVLPISLAIMLIENWVFGSFLCYFAPILQDVPSHVTMLTLFMMAVDRYKYLLDPSKDRLPAYVFATGTWLSGICIALPYPIYTTYIDFSRYFKDQLNGVGICVLNLADDSHDYMRSLFFLT